MRHALEGGCRLVYIAQSVQREPLDQTHLKNDGDAILKAVENRHNNEADRWGPQRPVARARQPHMLETRVPLR